MDSVCVWTRVSIKARVIIQFRQIKTKFLSLQNLNNYLFQSEMMMQREKETHCIQLNVVIWSNLTQGHKSKCPIEIHFKMCWLIPINTNVVWLLQFNRTEFTLRYSMIYLQLKATQMSHFARLWPNFEALHKFVEKTNLITFYIWITKVWCTKVLQSYYINNSKSNGTLITKKKKQKKKKKLFQN